MKPRVFVLSDRQEPWTTSYFVLNGSHVVAQGRTWQQAMRIANRLARSTA